MTDTAIRVPGAATGGDEPLGRTIEPYAGYDLVHLRQIAKIRQAIGAPPA